MNAKQILLRVFSGILALVCVLCLVLQGLGLKQALDCKSYWEEEGAKANESFDMLEDGINQLRDNELAYLDGVEEYEEGLEEYEEGEAALAAGAANLSDGQAQYDDGAAQLAAAHQLYDENMAKLQAAKAELEAGKAELEAGKARVAAGEAELAAHQQEYEEGKAQLAQVAPIYESAAAGRGQIEELKAERERYAELGMTNKVTELDFSIMLAEQAYQTSLGGYTLDGIMQQYEEGQAKIAEYEAGMAEVEAGRKQVAEGEARIADSERQIAEAEAKLAEAKAILDQKDQDLANAGDRLAAGYAEYAAGQETLANGAAQLADGLAMLGEYEGGQDQVVEGLEMVLATDTYYNKAKQPLVTAIADRMAPDFTYWTLDEEGLPVYLNGQKFLNLEKSLEVVSAGRAFLADTSDVVTKEITGRLLVWIAAAAAVVIGLVSAILGLFGRRIGALIPAALSMAASLAAIMLALFFGMEDPMSVIARTGTVGIVVVGVIALAVAALLVLIFAAIPGSGRTKPAAKAAETAEPAEA